MNPVYLSTLDSRAGELARRYGLGVEIADFTTPWNLDEQRGKTLALVESRVGGIQQRLLHGPFSELFPCAIDPEIRRVAARRYRQTIALAKELGAGKVIFHGGFQERMYYPVWYVEQSIQFWRGFLTEDPGVEIVLENVFEPEPELLMNILKGVDSPRLGLCLDVGHVSAYSAVPVERWLEQAAPYLSHLHLHNNFGRQDTHNPLMHGTIPMKPLLRQLQALTPQATLTLELTDAESSVKWLIEEGMLEKVQPETAKITKKCADAWKWGARQWKLNETLTCSS